MRMRKRLTTPSRGAWTVRLQRSLLAPYRRSLMVYMVSYYTCYPEGNLRVNLAGIFRVCYKYGTDAVNLAGNSPVSRSQYMLWYGRYCTIWYNTIFVFCEQILTPGRGVQGTTFFLADNYSGPKKYHLFRERDRAQKIINHTVVYRMVQIGRNRSMWYYGTLRLRLWECFN